MACIENQISRKGVTVADIVAGVGDGGGENEGRTSGVHAIVMNSVPSYVKRRCGGHFAWRVANQGLIAMGDLYESLKSLNMYLRDGITWFRLQSLATTSVANGGLALFTQTSRKFINMFNKAPPAILEDRPETVALFLKWLLPKQHTLRDLVAADIGSRQLEMRQAPIAAATLKSQHDTIFRYIAYVLIEKSLYLFY